MPIEDDVERQAEIARILDFPGMVGVLEVAPGDRANQPLSS
jgi:hypothetical protein